MFSRAYRVAITVPPLAMGRGVSARSLPVDVLLQLLVGLRLAGYRSLLESFDNYANCSPSRSTGRRCCARCGSPRASRCSRSCSAIRSPTFSHFRAARRKELYYQLVIIPLWVSYLVRAYAWKTILGTDGVLNTLLQYAHLTRHPLDFLLYSPFAVVLTLTHIYTPSRYCRSMRRSNTFRAIWSKPRMIWARRLRRHSGA